MTTGVTIDVLRSSTGPVLQEGDHVGVLYSGSLLNGDGTPFDANYDFNTFALSAGRQLFRFTLGAGQVIQGWDQGLLGRRLGEVLDLTIPAALAYGSRGALPAIPPDADLRFRVELVGAIPVGQATAVYPSYRELGLSGKLSKQLEALDVGVDDIKIATDIEDTLLGSDQKDLLIGLAGDDWIQGGAAPDVLIGGAGRNRYVYGELSDSPATPGQQDRVLGFNASRDTLDLSTIADARVMVGKRAFSGAAGEVRLANGVLQLDADGDRAADFEILMPGVNRLGGSSLLL